MKRLIAALVVPFIVGSPAMAGVSINERDTYNRQDNEVEQENVGVVNQTAVYNLGQSSVYQLGNVTCPDTNLMFSANTTEFDNYSISGAIVIPLGGRTKDACVKSAEVFAERMAFDAEMSFKSECLGLQQAFGNVTFNDKFPTLAKYCN